MSGFLTEFQKQPVGLPDDLINILSNVCIGRTEILDIEKNLRSGWASFFYPNDSPDSL